jgi:hypothetical protein
MTIEEAKEIIERKSSIPFDGETFEKIENAYDMAIKALKKQIPKKVDLEGDGYADGQLVYDKPCEMYNVGAMLPYMDFTPKTLEEILSACKEKH